MTEAGAAEAATGAIGTGAIATDWAFPPQFAAFGRTLRLGAPDAIGLPELFAPARLGPVARRYAARYPGGDARAVLSMWSQHYLLALIPAAAAAILAAGREVPIAFGGMAATLTETGQPDALCVPHEGREAAGSCPAACLTPLLRAHLEPLAARLGAAGLPARVFWGNAGAALAWTLEVVALVPRQREAVRAALGAACWVDGGPNPLCPVLACGGCTLRRRVCCLRFRLPGTAMCPDCPRACGRG